MSTRPELAARTRAITGKAVARLRRQGQLPAVLYGRDHPSEALVVDAREFETLRRHAGRHALVDLKVDGHRARPVMIHGVQEHPVGRQPLHVDFFLVRMTEELTVDVPIVSVGTSFAVEKLGGTLLHDLDSLKVRALPADIPSEIRLDVSPLDSFEAVLHVRDLELPERVTLVNDPDEPVAHVSPPRVEEEIAAPVAEAEVPAEEGAAAAEAVPAEGEATEG